MDRNPGNSDPDNLVWLCLNHHDEYDGRTSQSKGLTEGEVRQYRKELYEFVSQQHEMLWVDDEVGPARNKRTRGGYRSPPPPPDLYRRRLRIYRVAKEFVRAACRGDDLTLDELFGFARRTDEAMFLFDDAVTEMLADYYRRGVRLHYTYSRLVAERLSPKTDWNELVRENSSLLLWFTEQFDVLRHTMKPFLRCL